MSDLANYNFAYLDEQTKRMIRRAILKAIAIPDVRWQDASDLVGRLRMIKSAEEIERLTAAAIATEAGARAAIAHIRPGCTADDLLAVFRSASSLRAAELGYAAPSFPISSITIGPRQGCPSG